MENITILKHQNQPMHHASSLSGLDPQERMLTEKILH